MYKLLIPSVAWSVTNLFSTIARGNLDVGSILGWGVMGQFMGVLLCMMLLTGFHVSFHSVASPLVLFGNIMGVVGGYFFLDALGGKKLSVVMPFISPLNMSLTMILGFLVLKEFRSLNAFHFIGMFFAVVTAVVLAIAERGDWVAILLRPFR